MNLAITPHAKDCQFVDDMVTVISCSLPLFRFLFFYKNLGQPTNTYLKLSSCTINSYNFPSGKHPEATTKEQNMLSFYFVALPVMATLIYNSRKNRAVVSALPDSQPHPSPSPSETLAKASSTAPCSLTRECGGQGAREKMEMKKEILLTTLPNEWALFPLRPPGKKVVGFRSPE